MQNIENLRHRAFARALDASYTLYAAMAAVNGPMVPAIVSAPASVVGPDRVDERTLPFAQRDALTGSFIF